MASVKRLTSAWTTLAAALLIGLAPSLARAVDPALRAKRLELIQKIFPGAQVRFDGATGRVDVNPAVKFSYYIYVPEPDNPQSPVRLVPMATSRFDNQSASTPEWYDAHRGENPMPKQDPAAVDAWLKANGLSTNPPTYLIDVQNGISSTQPLQDYLLDLILKRNPGDHVVLYRGAERPNERANWEAGYRPLGARYWAYDANYAWRYGRKIDGFLDATVLDEAPIFRFEISKDEFVRQVRSGELTLGTELTKRVHDSFDRSGRFTDQLSGGEPYLGAPELGIEIETRATLDTTRRFPSYYQRSVRVEELANERILLLKAGYERASRAAASAGERERLARTLAQRIRRTELERDLLAGIRDFADPAVLEPLLQKLSDTTGNAEIGNVDNERFESFAHRKIRDLAQLSAEQRCRMRLLAAKKK